MFCSCTSPRLLLPLYEVIFVDHCDQQSTPLGVGTEQLKGMRVGSAPLLGGGSPEAQEPR